MMGKDDDDYYDDDNDRKMCILLVIIPLAVSLCALPSVLARAPVCVCVCLSVCVFLIYVRASVYAHRDTRVRHAITNVSKRCLFQLF
jgi:hypothetical protein